MAHNLLFIFNCVMFNFVCSCIASELASVMSRTSDIPSLCVLSDATTEKIALQKWAASESKIEVI